ncbi:hypothetical protein [Barnesiella intestinihominis]|uniref:hypothetical protein n=1 Tax=Barnesiella intestinihominis TaxID=487174 RepID=UPI003AB7E134
MKRISLVSLIIMLSFVSAFSQKTYSDKARTPQPDDYTYQDYSYTYNLDADGRLTGNNVFTVNYQAAPCKGKLYQYIGKTMKTGKESMKITFTGENSGTVTYSNNVIHWYYDKTSYTWKKRFNDKLYGTYTFRFVDNCIQGNVTIPIGFYNNTSNYTFLKFNSVNSTIPAGSRLQIGYKDNGVFKPYTDIDETLLISSKSEYADKTEILDVLKMIDDIEDFTFYKYVGVSEEGETYVKLLFPATSSDFLILYGSYNIKDRMYFKLPKINVLFGVEPTE